MSALRVTAERLTIHPHSNADLLELAQVGLYRAVVGKGVYQTGDWAIYIPESAVIPPALIEELGLVGKLAGPDKNRVKAVRLRGELSQGIVCRPQALDGIDLADAHTAGQDFAEALGVVKWVPPIPVHMAGQVEAAPDLLPWVDIENIKRYPTIFEPGEPVVATEKIHGTACLFSLVNGTAYVSSKGFGSQRLAIQRDPKNLYWRAVEGHGVAAVAEVIAAEFDASRVGIFGEVYGKNVQDLAYGCDPSAGVPGYAVFDIAVELNGDVYWLSPSTVLKALDGQLPSVPVLYEGPYDEALLLKLAEGRESVSGTKAHIREGLVVRANPERYTPVTGGVRGRAIAKFVADSYLVRKGGTEFE